MLGAEVVACSTPSQTPILVVHGNVGACALRNRECSRSPTQRAGRHAHASATQRCARARCNVQLFCAGGWRMCTWKPRTEKVSSHARARHAHTCTLCVNVMASDFFCAGGWCMCTSKPRTENASTERIVSTIQHGPCLPCKAHCQICFTVHSHPWPRDFC